MEEQVQKRAGGDRNHGELEPSAAGERASRARGWALPGQEPEEWGAIPPVLWLRLCHVCVGAGLQSVLHGVRCQQGRAGVPAPAQRDHRRLWRGKASPEPAEGRALDALGPANTGLPLPWGEHTSHKLWKVNTHLPFLSLQRVMCYLLWLAACLDLGCRTISCLACAGSLFRS